MRSSQARAREMGRARLLPSRVCVHRCDKVAWSRSFSRAGRYKLIQITRRLSATFCPRDPPRVVMYVRWVCAFAVQGFFSVFNIFVYGRFIFGVSGRSVLSFPVFVDSSVVSWSSAFINYAIAGTIKKTRYGFFTI